MLHLKKSFTGKWRLGPVQLLQPTQGETEGCEVKGAAKQRLGLTDCLTSSGHVHSAPGVTVDQLQTPCEVLRPRVNKSDSLSAPFQARKGDSTGRGDAKLGEQQVRRQIPSFKTQFNSHSCGKMRLGAGAWGVGRGKCLGVWGYWGRERVVANEARFWRIWMPRSWPF